ncbi:hypothetical protein IAT38_002244 [Cryptococcus sp. DSM 104549]
MAIRRLLTSLAAHPPSSSQSASRLVPPYSHTYNPTTPTTLRPPYSYTAAPAHGLPLPLHETRGRGLKAAVKYELHQREARVDGWSEWAEGVLSSDSARKEVEVMWREAIEGLENIKASGNQIPQMEFYALSSHLASESAVDAIRTTGAVVVRDVVPDAEAIEWARAILQAVSDAGGRAIYWHLSLLAARADPSVLSANAQLAAALLGQEVYVQADTIREGLSPFRTTPNPSAPWSAPRALLSHLALTPLLPSPTGAAPRDTLLPPSIHASTYALLRPLFRPLKSKISFYDSGSYLDPSNWVLDPPAKETRTHPDLPHLAGTEVVLPELAPGDLFLHHTALPLASQPAGQVFLPVHPVARQGNEEWVVKQKESFEKGVPPPGVGGEGEELYVVEGKRVRGDIPSRSGREAMGY